MSLRLGSKFIALVAVILSATLGLSALYSLHVQSRLLQEQLFEKVRILGETSVPIGTEAILAFDFVALDKYVRDITQRRDLVFSVFLDAKQRPLTSYLDLHNPHLSALMTDNQQLSVDEVLQAFRQGRDPQVVLREFPIVHRDAPIGYLVLGVSTQRLNEQLDDALLQQLSVYVAIILVLAAGIFFVFRANVLGPIRRLQAGAKRIADGEFGEPVPISSPDELGELTESFNAMMRDVREDRELLNYQAYYDSLTGLPNRMLAMEHLYSEINRAYHDRTRFAVLFIDLDNFKLVNDTMGHQFGDELLKVISQRFKAVLRESDTIARLGGDEFLVLLPTKNDPAEIHYVADRLLDSMSEAVQLNEREVFIHCSIGIALFPDDGNTADVLMANADNAMYQAKLTSGGSVCFFAPEMNVAVKERLNLEHDLHLALERGEFRLNYQPIVDANSGRHVGAEALLRWHHPQKGVISPLTFIPLAETTGRIIAIGEWVMREACRQFAEWHTSGLTPGFVSVNVSRVQFHGNLETVVRRALEESGLPPGRLHLEITESVLMEHKGVVPEVLTRLNEAGVQLALDDFGTGFSSLNYLKHFPFRVLKIDKSFVDGLPHNSGDAALVRGIIAMAESLGLDVISEGVEREIQWKFLRATGSHFIQGFLFGRPMNAEAFATYLQETKSDSGPLTVVASEQRKSER